MIDDMFRLTIDKLFQTKYSFNKGKILDTLVSEKSDKVEKQDKKEKDVKHNKENNKIEDKYISPYPVEGYTLDENMW